MQNQESDSDVSDYSDRFSDDSDFAEDETYLHFLATALNVKLDPPANIVEYNVDDLINTDTSDGSDDETTSPGINNEEENTEGTNQDDPTMDSDDSDGPSEEQLIQDEEQLDKDIERLTKACTRDKRTMVLSRVS